MNLIHRMCLVLVLIGAVNWGLWGFFQFDLVAAVFGGNTSAASRFIYSLVGIAALVEAGFALYPLKVSEASAPYGAPSKNLR